MTRRASFSRRARSESLELAGPDHPYGNFVSNDVVRHAIHRDARRDHLTYFNTSPRLYRSTDIANCVAYDTSAYVRFYEGSMQAHCTLTLAFGVNAYIELMFWRTAEEGDFTDEEQEEFEQLYAYIASSYRPQPAPFCGLPPGRRGRLRHDGRQQLRRYGLCLGAPGQRACHEPPRERLFPCAARRRQRGAAAHGR